MKSRIKDEEAVSRDMSEAFKGETVPLTLIFVLAVVPDKYHSLSFKYKFSHDMFIFVHAETMVDNSKCLYNFKLQAMIKCDNLL